MIGRGKKKEAGNTINHRRGKMMGMIDELILKSKRRIKKK